MTSYSALASVPTAHASRYLQQLCKHWAHHLRVEFDASRGAVAFPREARGADHPGDGIAAFDATSAEQLDSLKGLVARHLDRFAFREAPLAFHWATPAEAARAQALSRAD